MEETTKKKILVVGHCGRNSIKSLLSDANSDVEFTENIKEIGKIYTDVIDTMPTEKLQLLKDGFDDLYPPISKKRQGLEVKPIRDSKKDPKLGRNESCPCGSGKKYKHCCFTCR